MQINSPNMQKFIHRKNFNIYSIYVALTSMILKSSLASVEYQCWDTSGWMLAVDAGWRILRWDVLYLGSNVKQVKELYIQSDLSNPDTLGTIPSVLFSEASWFQGIKTASFGAATTVPFIEVPLFQSVLIEGFYCMYHRQGQVGDARSAYEPPKAARRSV